MATLNSINAILQQLRITLATIGFTTAGLMGVINCIIILVHTDNSPAARSERWGKLRTVFVIAVIIAGISAFLLFAQNIGRMVQ